jgi:hypothetical protein
MYFVTIGGQVGYVLFSATPRGHAAVGLTEKGDLQLLAPGSERGKWQILREWKAERYSQTELMLLLGSASEPERAEDLLALLPPETLG